MKRNSNRKRMLIGQFSLNKLCYFVLFFTSFLALAACKEEGPEPVNETLMEIDVDGDGQADAPLFTAKLSSSGSYTVSGDVFVFETESGHLLRFENFKSSNGPDVRIYLAEDTQAQGFVDLGVIKSTQGNFSYDIPESVNLNTKSYVLVWCEDFSVLFGSGKLMMP